MCVCVCVCVCIEDLVCVCVCVCVCIHMMMIYLRLSLGHISTTALFNAFIAGWNICLRSKIEYAKLAVHR